MGTETEFIRLHTLARIPSNQLMIVAVRIVHRTTHFEHLFHFEWLPSQRSYRAQPVVYQNGQIFSVRLNGMPDPWIRLIKRRLFEAFGIRHVHNIGPIKNNSTRIDTLLRVRTTTQPGA